MLRKELLSELEEFVKSRINMAYRSLQSAVCFDSSIHDELEGFVESNRKLTFNQVLFEYIDGKKAADADIYKRAGIDRRHFSKIRSNPEYRPGKNTVVALALALRLDVENACRLCSPQGIPCPIRKPSTWSSCSACRRASTSFTRSIRPWITSA